MGEYVIAKYIRLSIEDAKTDSMSIENQRLLIDKHIAGLDVPGTEVLEFIDNGHTGTNFERPGVQEILELVRAGKINCIIVKDFSRFGRNSIETGYFIERVFPLYRVRFISVSDRFDSAEYEGNTGGMEVAFKFLMHEYYSKDLSKKIKAAKHEKMRRGEAVKKDAAFGYRLNEARQIVIDEPAAEVVRMIFRLAAEGCGLVEIERRLYEGKHPTPGEHKKHRKDAYQSELSCVWHKSVILQILQNEQYLGTYIAGKTCKPEIGSHSQVKKSKSEWIMIPHHHPAIIDEALFEAVRERISQRKEPLRARRFGTSERYAENLQIPLRGKVSCGCCNHAMALSSTRNARFHCTYTRAVHDAECHRLSVLAHELSDMLFEVISKQAEVILNVDKLNDIGQIDARLARQTEYERQIAALNSRKRSLYERFILGELTIEGYKAEKVSIDAELARLGQINTALSSELETLTQDGRRKKLASHVRAENRLTPALVDLLIEKVLIFPGERVEIKWKVADFFDAVDVG